MKKVRSVFQNGAELVNISIIFQILDLLYHLGNFRSLGMRLLMILLFMRMMTHIIVLSASNSVFRGGKKRKLRLLSMFYSRVGGGRIPPPTT